MVSASAVPDAPWLLYVGMRWWEDSSPKGTDDLCFGARAICGQRYPLPCFAWLWIWVRESRVACPTLNQESLTPRDRWPPPPSRKKIHWAVVFNFRSIVNKVVIENLLIGTTIPHSRHWLDTTWQWTCFPVATKVETIWSITRKIFYSNVSVQQKKKQFLRFHCSMVWLCGMSFAFIDSTFFYI